MSAVKWRVVSEPLGVSQERTAGGEVTPSGRKARRASCEIRHGVESRTGVAVGFVVGFVGEDCVVGIVVGDWTDREG